jgi:adenosine deaminase
MLKHGMRATDNSDDPAYFGGYMNENDRAIANAGVIDRNGLIELARNRFLGSFLPLDEVQMHLDAIDAYVATCAT